MVKSLHAFTLEGVFFILFLKSGGRSMARKENSRFMPFYFDDFEDATTHLTDKQKWIYFRMIWWQFHNKAPFKSSEHARKVLSVSSRDCVIIDTLLTQFCVKTDTGWLQNRTFEEIKKIASKSELARESANCRWKNNDANALLEEKRREEKRREEKKNSQKKENDVSVSDDFLVSETLEKKESEKPQTVKAFASEAQAYAEAQAKACEAETAVLYRFSWVLAWLSTYQTPEEAVRRGVGEPELLDLFKQAVDASISTQKAHNPRYVQAVFRNSVEAWTPQARSKPMQNGKPVFQAYTDEAWEGRKSGEYILDPETNELIFKEIS
jgi:uncharacterized protein YdaU (DUF1376 family)